MNKTPPKLSLDQFAERISPRKWPAVRRMLAIVKGEVELTKAHPERGRLAWIEKRLPALTETHLEAFRVDPVTGLPEGRPSLKADLEMKVHASKYEPILRASAEEEARITLWEPVKKRYQRRSKAFLTQMTAQVEAELQQPGVAVTARNKHDAREPLDPTDIQGAVIDIGGGRIVKKGWTWVSVSVQDARTRGEVNADVAEPSATNGATAEARAPIVSAKPSAPRVNRKEQQEETRRRLVAIYGSDRDPTAWRDSVPKMKKRLAADGWNVGLDTIRRALGRKT